MNALLCCICSVLSAPKPSQNAEAFQKPPSNQGKYFGIESHVLSPSEVKDVHPLLRVDDIYGGVYSPGDGTIDPTSICNAYAKASRKFGGGVYENVGVSGIEVEDYLTAGSAPARRIKAVPGILPFSGNIP